MPQSPSQSVRDFAGRIIASKANFRFFSLTHFLRASSHWTKVKHAVAEHIQENTTVRIMINEDEDSLMLPMQKAYFEELLDIHCKVRACLSQVRMPDGDNQQKTGGFERKLKDFRKMWGGCDLTSTNPRYEHVCFRSGPTSTWCCTTDAESKKKMSNSLLAILLDIIPDVPAPGKWTKLWSSLSFIAP